MTRLTKNVAVIVAHPDDETLWTGGTILCHPLWNCYIITLCRGSDPDRAPRFKNVLKILNARGSMGDMDDGPDQIPLEDSDLERTITGLLPSKHYDLVITHSPVGEYTSHRRHEETGANMIRLWYERKINCDDMWLFAYDDNDKTILPQARADADMYTVLPSSIWQKKYNIITEAYGFRPDSFEAQTTPRAESFWQFSDPAIAWNMLQHLKD